MQRLTRLCLEHPKAAFALLLLATVVLGAGVPRVEQAYGFRVMVGSEHPAIQALDSLVEGFAGGYPVRIAWECGAGHPCENVFDPASLEMAEALTRELSTEASIMNVVGPANASVLVPGEDGFTARRLVENGAVVRDADALAARSEPLWVGDLVSADARLGVLVLQPADNQSSTEVRAADTIESILEPHRERGFSYFVVGDAPGAVSSGRALAQSTSDLIPYLALVIGVLLYLLTGSWQQTGVTLATMGVALLWTLGVLGWLAWPQDGILQVLAPVVVIVGVCDAVHFLHRYAAERLASPGRPSRHGLLAAARDAGPACVITSLTSGAAFASFAFSDLDTFLRFGVILTIGVLICLLLSFSLLPLLIDKLPAEAPRPARVSRAWAPLMDGALSLSSTRAPSLLAASALLLGVFGFGWAVHLSADTNLNEAIGDKSEHYHAVASLEEALGSSQTLELDIRLPPEARIEDVDTLDRIAALSQGLSRVPGLGQAESVLNLIRRLNRLVHADAPEFERIGASAHANAQLLELLAFDDPDTLGRWLSLDRSRLRISLASLSASHAEREAALVEVRRQVRQALPESWDVRLTGEFAVSHAWVRDLQATQLRSFPIAFGLVFILVSIFLRSWKLGLAAMVPTLLPVVVVLGAMGWLGMSLDVARAMIAAVVIGIGVDDAIHVLSHYKKRRDAGDTSHEAMGAALRHSGRAVVTTSIALSLGFLTLMMSAWQTVASFGLFVAISIIGALVATLLVLPALVFVAAPRPALTHRALHSPSHSPLNPATPLTPSTPATATLLRRKD